MVTAMDVHVIDDRTTIDRLSELTTRIDKLEKGLTQIRGMVFKKKKSNEN